MKNKKYCKSTVNIAYCSLKTAKIMENLFEFEVSLISVNYYPKLMNTVLKKKKKNSMGKDNM